MYSLNICFVPETLIGGMEYGECRGDFPFNIIIDLFSIFHCLHLKRLFLICWSLWLLILIIGMSFGCPDFLPCPNHWHAVLFTPVCLNRPKSILVLLCWLKCAFQIINISSFVGLNIMFDIYCLGKKKGRIPYCFSPVSSWISILPSENSLHTHLPRSYLLLRTVQETGKQSSLHSPTEVHNKSFWQVLLVGYKKKTLA